MRVSDRCSCFVKSTLVAFTEQHLPWCSALSWQGGLCALMILRAVSAGALCSW